MYLSTDSVITAADILMETFTTPTPLQPGGSVFFPLIEGDTNSVDVPAGVAPGQYFVGYLADDVGLQFETNEANNYVSALVPRLTVVVPVVITTTSPLPSGLLQAPYPATQLTATGGTGRITGSLLRYLLPPGLTLSDGGVISGTPSSFGTYTFGVRVSDSAASPQSAVKTLSLFVDPGIGPPLRP